MARPVHFTPYARAKFAFLREHGFRLTEDDVRRAVLEPDRVSRVRLGRWVAQRMLTERHLVRVIYEELPRERVVITFYPARRSRDEPTHEL